MAGRNPLRIFRWPVLVIAVVAGNYVLRFLVGSIYGFLLISIAVYAYFYLLGESRPLTFSELTLWIDGLGIEHKIALVSTALTVFGFLVAFQIGSSTAREEALITLRMSVASDVEEFFTESGRLLVQVDIYARTVLELGEKIRKEPNSEGTLWAVRHFLRGSVAFFDVRNRLRERSITVHRLLGRNFGLLASVWNTVEPLTQCISAFEEMTTAMWFVPLVLREDDPDLVAHVGQLIDMNRGGYEKFIEAFKRNYSFINSVSGMIRGLLMAPVLGSNLPSVVTLVRLRNRLREISLEVDRRQRNG